MNTGKGSLSPFLLLIHSTACAPTGVPHHVTPHTCCLVQTHDFLWNYSVSLIVSGLEGSYSLIFIHRDWQCVGILCVENMEYISRLVWLVSSAPRLSAHTEARVSRDCHVFTRAYTFIATMKYMRYYFPHKLQFWRQCGQQFVELACFVRALVFLGTIKVWVWETALILPFLWCGNDTLSVCNGRHQTAKSYTLPVQIKLILTNSGWEALSLALR